jgi:hypothetical protein
MRSGRHVLTQSAAQRRRLEMKKPQPRARTSKATGLGRIVARRVLTEEGSHLETEVTIGTPRAVPGSDWACPFQISSVIDSRVQYAYGGDSVQALQSALQGIHVALEKTGRRFRWFGLASSGFPAQIPGLTGGKRFAARLEALILREQAIHLREQAIHLPEKKKVLKDARKMEIAQFETELELLKKHSADPPHWVNKKRLKADISQREVELRRFKKQLQTAAEPKTSKSADRSARHLQNRQNKAK